LSYEISKECERKKAVFSNQACFGETEENYENMQSGCLVYRLRTESWNPQYKVGELTTMA
jgi:hypothetical protein